MAEQNRTTLKNYFQTGDRPSQAQYADLIDSVFVFEDQGDWEPFLGKIKIVPLDIFKELSWCWTFKSSKIFLILSWWISFQDFSRESK